MGVQTSVTISALPDDELIISLTSSDPRVIIISTPNVTLNSLESTAMFTIEAAENTMGGQYYIMYSLSGASASDYAAPTRSAIFVRPNQAENEPNYFEERGLAIGELDDAGCFMAPQSLQCPRDGQQINLLSTSQWSTVDNIVMSQGVLHLVYGRLSLPLSIIGANITVEQSVLLVQRLTSQVP